ncbi:MAG: hypothetical protein R3C52_00920 [Hyphomonadaceae bacterium]
MTTVFEHVLDAEARLAEHSTASEASRPITLDLLAHPVGLGGGRSILLRTGTISWFWSMAL